jgi:hypothetical protein
MGATAAAATVGTLIKETEVNFFLKKTEVLFMRFIFFIVVLLGFIYLYNAQKAQKTV